LDLAFGAAALVGAVLETARAAAAGVIFLCRVSPAWWFPLFMFSGTAEIAAIKMRVKMNLIQETGSS
jgi:hypothetical protein